jgi:hypothetical protein
MMGILTSDNSLSLHPADISQGHSSSPSTKSSAIAWRASSSSSGVASFLDQRLLGNWSSFWS